MKKSFLSPPPPHPQARVQLEWAECSSQSIGANSIKEGMQIRHKDWSLETLFFLDPKVYTHKIHSWTPNMVSPGIISEILHVLLKFTWGIAVRSLSLVANIFWFSKFHASQRVTIYLQKFFKNIYHEAGHVRLIIPQPYTWGSCLNKQNKKKIYIYI